MGLNIGQVTGILSALRSAPEFGRVRLREDAAPKPGLNAQERPEPFALPPRRGEPEPVRVGFGEGTVSPLTAALRTIDRTIQTVRENQPTIDEIRQQFQTRAAERRAEISRQTRGEEPEALRPVERGVPEASPRVREFAATDPAPAIEPLAQAREDSGGPIQAAAPREARFERLESTADQERTARPGLDVRV